MAKKISELTEAGSVTDSDILPLVQSATTKKVSASTLKSYFASRVVAKLSPGNTANQNRDILITAIKQGRDQKKSIYVTGNGNCPLARVSITGLTDNATTISLGAGQKIHIEVDDNTVLMNQLGEICLEVDVSDNTTEVTPSAFDAAYGNNTIFAEPPTNSMLYAGEYLRITVPSAAVFAKYDMVTLHDQTFLLTNESGETYSFQQEDFEVLGVDTTNNYVYISKPLHTYNLATAKLVKWNNKDTEFSLKGGRYRSDPAAGDFESKTLLNRKIFMRIMGIKSPTLRDLVFSDGFFGFCQITHSLAFKADNVRTERTRNQSNPNNPDYRSLAYIFDFYGANKLPLISNCIAFGGRHIFTTNTPKDTSYNSNNRLKYGWLMFGAVDGINAAFNQGGPLDNHEAAYGTTWRNVTVMGGVNFTDGLISPRGLSDRGCNTTAQNITVYGQGHFCTLDGFGVDHKQPSNTAHFTNCRMLRPMHRTYNSTLEDAPFIESLGKSGMAEKRHAKFINFEIDGFGKMCKWVANSGTLEFNNLMFTGDIYQVSDGTNGRPGFEIQTNNTLIIRNSVLDFRNANYIKGADLSIDNTLKKLFGSLVGNCTVIMENVAILGASFFKLSTSTYLFSNDGTGTKTILYRNVYWDDPTITAITGGVGVTLTQMGSAGNPVDVQVYDANATWTKPSGATMIEIEVIGGGGSGAGAGASNGTAAIAGGTGGGSGAYARRIVKAADLPATVAVTVGAAVAGPAGGTATVGTLGTNGNDSSFGTYVRANGGKGGGSGTTGGAGGAYGTQVGNAGSNSTAGAAGTGAAPNSTTPGIGLTGGGGGSGGGIAASMTTAFVGGAGGRYPMAIQAAGSGAAGAIDGAGGNGTSPPITSSAAGGGGGGGGGSSITGNGGAGGNGAAPGGGGGGGGAAASGFTGGQGGQGAAGRVVVISY